MADVNSERAGTSGSSGSGYLGLPSQSSAPATPSSGFRFFADSLNRFAWKGANGFKRIFDGISNTADRIYTLPDASGTIRVIAYSGTWAGKPAANSVVSGTEIFVTDMGINGSMWRSDGAKWSLANSGELVLSQTAVPVILCPSGTWTNTTGTMTLGTALPYTPVGRVRVALFASGITAGLYYATFSSTTAMQVWTDAAATTKPTTVAGAYTPTTATDILLASTALGADSMGLNGGLRIQTGVSTSNNANSKQSKIKLSGSQVATTQSYASGLGGAHSALVRNRGSKSAQSSHAIGSYGASSPTFATIDTTVALNVELYGQIAVATDYLILDAYTIELIPS